MMLLDAAQMASSCTFLQHTVGIQHSCVLPHNPAARVLHCTAAVCTVAVSCPFKTRTAAMDTAPWTRAQSLARKESAPTTALSPMPRYCSRSAPCSLMGGRDKQMMQMMPWIIQCHWDAELHVQVLLVIRTLQLMEGAISYAKWYQRLGAQGQAAVLIATS